MSTDLRDSIACFLESIERRRRSGGHWPDSQPGDDVLELEDRVRNLEFILIELLPVIADLQKKSREY